METLQNSVTKLIMGIDLDGRREYLVERSFLYSPDFHVSLVDDDISLILKVRKHTKTSIHFRILANNNKKTYVYQLLGEFVIRAATLQKMSKETLCKRALEKLKATEFSSKDLCL